jgi:hypothetical protein
MVTITADFDHEARTWVATSDDVPGLCIEAPTIDALTERLKVVVPEMLALSDGPDVHQGFRIEARRGLPERPTPNGFSDRLVAAMSEMLRHLRGEPVDAVINVAPTGKRRRPEE